MKDIETLIGDLREDYDLLTYDKEQESAETAKIANDITMAIVLLREQETTFEKDGHHIRCTSCGNYWCDTDREGNLFPHNYCPYCGRKVKVE